MNSTIFTLFGFEVRWYSVILLVAVAVAYFLLKKEAMRFKINWDFIFNLFFWVVIFGIIGARVYYVMFNWSSYQEDFLSVFKIWEGGLAIHGGIIAGSITAFIYCKKCKANTLKIIDMAVPSLMIAQAIGRWGNFFNSEAHGVATTLSNLEKLKIPEFVIKGMNIDGVYYHPTFLYESISCLLGFIVLLIVRRNRYTKIGTLTGTYLVWYSFGRFIIENLRTDSLMLGGFKIAQIISVILFIVGVVLILINKKKTKFESLYNSDEDNNIRF